MIFRSIVRSPGAVFPGLMVFLLSVSPAFAVTVTSSTHAAFVTHDFSGTAIPFVAYQRDGGVPSGASFKVEDGALVITNAHAGSFGVETKTAVFDAEKYSRVVFDYALSPGVKVNFFFRLKENNVYHGVTFSGPNEVRPGSVLLGAIPNVAADGKWHRAEIPLRDWLRKLYPTKAQLIIDEIIIGNWDNTNYLMALGVGGNGVGATWKIDNFAILGSGPAQTRFEIKNDNGEKLANPQEYSWSLDGGAPKPLTAAEWSITADAGLHVLRILDKTKKVVASHAFWVAPDAPQIGKPELHENSLNIPIESRAGLNWANLKLTVDGRSFQLDSPFLTWDGAAGVLTLDAAAANIRWSSGQQVPIALEGVSDVLNRAAEPFKTSLAVDFARHKTAPPLPRLEYLKEIGDGTFEESLDEWAPRTDWEGAAIVERDSSTAASGKYSVRLTASSNAGHFGAYIRRTPFDAAKYPVIEFDYCIPPELRADFVFDWDGQINSVAFTDRTPQWPRIGTLPNIVADGKWHHAQIRLYDLMRAARPGATSFRINWFAIADGGWLGNAKGLRYWFDNFHFVPVVPGAPFESRVLASDVTGLKGVAWSLDDSAKTEVQPAAKAEQAVQISGAGAKWLHLRAQNGAGQWSPTSHMPLILDTNKPTTGAAAPAAGAKTSTEVLEIPVRDDNALDFSALALNVQGREYSVRDAALSYEAERLTFSLDRAVQDGQLKPLDDGARIAWTLKSVRDVAGQSVPDVSGEWTHDFAQDKSGPGVQLSTSTHTTSIRDTFDQDLNTGSIRMPRRELNRWLADSEKRPMIWLSENMKVERGQREENENDKTLRATVTTANAPTVLRLMRTWDTAQFPMIGFFYKATPGTNMMIRVRGGNANGVIGFLGPVPKEAVGEVANPVADGKWHWASINLAPLQEKLKTPQIQMFEFVDSSNKAAANATFEIDDFTVQKAPAGNIKLNWKAFDISGVQSYRFAWDGNPATQPAEETTDTAREIAPASGTWWAHLQARDRAGNWSEVAHLPIMIP